MCSRRLLLLLLLCALAFVEVSSWPTPRLPLIEDNIDLAKCVATRKGNNQYACFLRSIIKKTTCIHDNQYVQESNITKRLPPPTLEKAGVCEFGCTIRPLTMYAWEIEVLFSGDDEFFIFEFVSDGGSSFIKVSLEEQKDPNEITDKIDLASASHFIPTIKEKLKNEAETFVDDVPNDKKIFDKNYRDPGSTVKYNAARYSKVYVKNGKHRYYVRFRLFRGGSAPKKMFTDFTQLVATVKTAVDGVAKRGDQVARVKLTDCHGQCDAQIYMNTCKQMVHMVHRKKYVSGWSQLTKIPREAFHHNVNDFTQMCTHLPRYNQPDQVFYPYHVETGREIVAIECLPEHENDKTELAPRIPYAIIRNVNGTAVPYNNFKNKYRDNNVNYQFVEVTCRSKEDICFYCGDPEWNKDTASMPKGLAPMTFTAGHNGSCATLTCPEDSLPYYPHIRFTSLEPPRCEHNAEKDAFEWTFSFQPTTQWNRVRRPLEKGYCRKKINCPEFTETMLACPKNTTHMPWFTGCVPANYTNVVAPRYYCANLTKQLYFAVSRRFLQRPVIGVVCNYDTGLYEAHLPNGTIETGFTEESWVVCRDKPIKPIDTYWNIKSDVEHRLAMGFAGILIPILIGLGFIAVYYPYAKCKRVQTENTLQPEQVNKTPVAAKKKGPVPTESKEESTKKEGEGEPRKKNVDEDYAKILAARAAMAKKMTEKYVVVDHNRDEKTCRVPTKSEQELMDELDRLAECTSETDQTGREVKPIAREDEPEKEIRR